MPKLECYSLRYGKKRTLLFLAALSQKLIEQDEPNQSYLVGEAWDRRSYGLSDSERMRKSNWECQRLG